MRKEQEVFNRLEPLRQQLWDKHRVSWGLERVGSMPIREITIAHSPGQFVLLAFKLGAISDTDYRWFMDNMTPGYWSCDLVR